MKLKTALLVVALAFAASSAHAASTKTTLSFDSNNVTFSAIGIDPTAFDDYFAFILPDVTDIDANFLVGKTQGIANAKVTTFALSGPGVGGPIVLGGAVPLAFQSSDAFFTGASAAGLYILEVKGSYLNAKGGSYAGNVSFTEAVPEPSAWAMMIAGLGMLGYMSIRRRNYF